MFNIYSFNVFIRNFVLFFFIIIVEVKKNFVLDMVYEYFYFFLNVDYLSVGSIIYG